jgi:hypothetical protein
MPRTIEQVGSAESGHCPDDFYTGRRRLCHHIQGARGALRHGSLSHNGSIIHRPTPIIIADITIRITSAVGHQEVRVAGSVMPLLPTSPFGRVTA